MLPRWATDDEHPEDAADDERLRAMTPEERLAELVEIWALMESILRERPDRLELLGRRDPLPAGWLAIVEQARSGREAG